MNFAVPKEGGGYIYHSGLVPNNGSFQQYKEVIELDQKYENNK